jgi:large subunit ribosomal protein L9
MKVLLIQDVENLGQAGEVQDVATGYGRNYLIPQGMAVLATPGELKKADLHRRRAAERRQRLADEMAALAESVRQTSLLFHAKAGETGRLYGSVTSSDVAEKLAEAVGQEIDRRRITMEGPIKDIGTHTVSLRLAADIVADFDVVVESIDDGEEPEQIEAGVEAEEPVNEFEADLSLDESHEKAELVEGEESGAEE